MATAWRILLEDLLRPALHAGVGLAVAGGAVWLGLTITETGQAIVTTVELVQEIRVVVQGQNGSLGEALSLLNENLSLAVEYFKQELGR